VDLAARLLVGAHRRLLVLGQRPEIVVEAFRSASLPPGTQSSHDDF
jgi:hypothetical protein